MVVHILTKVRHILIAIAFRGHLIAAHLRWETNYQGVHCVVCIHAT
jgi:hypothetical protein